MIFWPTPPGPSPSGEGNALARLLDGSQDSPANAVQRTLTQLASVLDSAKATARLVEPIRLVSGGEMAEWLKATVC